MSRRTKVALSGEHIGQLCRRTHELVGQVVEGTLPFDRTMTALQALIEGKRMVVAPEPPENESVTEICQTFAGCRCTICGNCFADGDDTCGGGHTIGQKYTRFR